MRDYIVHMTFFDISVHYRSRSSDPAHDLYGPGNLDPTRDPTSTPLEPPYPTSSPPFAINTKDELLEGSHVLKVRSSQ